jgi:calcineurin-like phosphoesterase family protein
MNNWFTSDFHLSHNNILKYCNRPFSSIEEMDETILNNLSSVLKTGSLLYFLGDLSFNKNSINRFFDLTDSMKVQVHFVFGNHDYRNKRIIEERAVWSGDLKAIKVNNQDLTITHYAMMVWPKSHFNSWNLYGHSHCNLKANGKQLDVGVDGHNFMPYSFEEIKEYMDARPNNFNFIKNVG